MIFIPKESNVKKYIKFDWKSKDYRVNLLFVDLLVFFSIISMFAYGSGTNGAQKDLAYEYLAETAIAQEKYHRIQAVYNSAEPLSMSDLYTYQRKSYGGTFYRRVNSYYGAGSNNELIDFSMNFDDAPIETFHAKAISVSTYTNINKLIETIQLELYKIIDRDFITENGFDGMCYLPSTIADAIIEQDLDDDISTYDDIINKKLAFSISGGPEGTTFSERWTVNNIFYTDEGHYDGVDAEGYLGKDKGYGKCLYSMLGEFIITTSTNVHAIAGSTLYFDFYNSLFLPKEYIEYAFGKSFASDGTTIDFYTYQNESWVKIQNLEFFSALYSANYSYIYDGNLFFFFCGILLLSLALYPLSKITDEENEAQIEHKYTKSIIALIIPFVVVHLIYNLTIRFLPLSIPKLMIYNIFGTTASILITIHILLMLFLPVILKKRMSEKRK